MFELVIKNLQPDEIDRLEERAKNHGCTREEEAQAILRATLAEKKNFAREFHRYFEGLGLKENELVFPLLKGNTKEVMFD